MPFFASLIALSFFSSPVYPFVLSRHLPSLSLGSAAVIPTSEKKHSETSTLNYHQSFNEYSEDYDNDINYVYDEGISGSPSSSSKSALYSLSVTELKRLLTDRGIDFRDCFEKQDLVDRLQTSPPSSGQSRGLSDHLNSSGSNHGLSDHERTLVHTFKRVSPAVANIKTSAVIPQRNSVFGLNLGADAEVPLGSGSGFLWDDKGHVVTNYHVISPPGTNNNDRLMKGKTVMVKLANMAEALEAKIVGFEPEKDIAVLRIVHKGNKGIKLPRPIDIGTSNDLQVGQSVLAIGNPFGLDDTLTTGIVSALGRDVKGIGGRPIHGCIQTDAAINPGNSGGPLLDGRGRLIGVNTMIYSPSGGNIGIGFAIPVDTVRRVVNQIIQYGKVVRPTIGINVVDDRIVRYLENQLGRPLDGCLVAQVIPNSPASVVGLEATSQSRFGSLVLGDLIVAVNGEPVRQSEDLIAAIEEKRERDVIDLTVMKECDPSKMRVVSVTLTTRDELQQQSNNIRNSNAVWQ